MVAKHGAKILKEILTHQDEELEPGGTTPWNPLRIPEKGITPAKKENNIPAGGGITPNNPLKIPGKNITPAKHN